MPKRAFLHLAPSEYAAKSVRNALASVGRDDEVIGWRDSYSDGPLSDADGARGLVESAQRSRVAAAARSHELPWTSGSLTW